MTERLDGQILFPDTSKPHLDAREKVDKRIQNTLKKLPLDTCEFDTNTFSWKAPKGYVFRVTGSFEVGSESNEMTEILPSRRLAAYEDFDRWEPSELPSFFDGKLLCLSEIGDTSLYIKGLVDVGTEVGGLGIIVFAENGEDKEYLFRDESAISIKSSQEYARIDVSIPATRFRIMMVKSDELDDIAIDEPGRKFVESFAVVPIASRPSEKLAPGDVRF